MHRFDLRPDSTGGFDFLVDGVFLRELVFEREERVWLYFCPECYDEGCGGVSVTIQIGDDRVTWSDFRHDAPTTKGELETFDDEDVITSVGTLVFDRAEYEAALDRTAKQLHSIFTSGSRSRR